MPAAPRPYRSRRLDVGTRSDEQVERGRIPELVAGPRGLDVQRRGSG